MPKQSKRILQFLRTRGQIVTFLGAIIVFSTFITKDVWRERIKNSSDSLQFDYSFFLLRLDHANHVNQLSRIELQTHPKGIQLGWFNGVTAYYDYAFILDAEARWPLQTVRTMQYQIRRLLSETTLNQEHKTLEQESIRQEKQWSELQTTTDKLSSEMYEEADRRLATRNKDKTKSDLDVVGRMFEASQAAHSLVIEQSNLGTAILRGAVEKHERMEKDYQLYSQLSYLFYSIGWSLGLLGRLIGIRGMAEEQ